jgi:hypothetical protein
MDRIKLHSHKSHSPYNSYVLELRQKYQDQSDERGGAKFGEAAEIQLADDLVHHVKIIHGDNVVLYELAAQIEVHKCKIYQVENNGQEKGGLEKVNVDIKA